MRVSRVRVIPAQVVEGVELQVDADLVVLKSNQGESQTRVAAEPELERDVKGVHRGAAGNNLRGEGLTAITVAVTARATLVEQVGQLRDVANHLGITSLLASLLSEFIPDMHPVTVLLVDALPSYLNFNIVNQIVTNPVEPTELSTRAIRRLKRYLRQSGLKVHAVDQITIALNGASDLLAKVGSTVEGVLNRFHGKVSVPAIHNLKNKNTLPFGIFMKMYSIQNTFCSL